MAAACVFPMSLPDADYRALLGSDDAVTGRFEPPLINIGVGTDVTIAELATLLARVVGLKVASSTNTASLTARCAS